MTYADALQHYGTQSLLAQALGITQPTVSAWQGAIPDKYQYQIEIITNGKLKTEARLRKPGAHQPSSDQAVA